MPRIKWDTDISLLKFEAGLVRELFEIFERPGAKVIYAQHRMTIRNPSIGKMGTKETGSARN